MPQYLDVFLDPIRPNEAKVAIIAVLILTSLDLVFGMLNAALSGEFESAKVREGLGHKCVSLGVIAVSDVVDATVIAGLSLGFSSPVLVAACMALCVMEIASLMEIFAKMRPDLAESPLWAIFRKRDFGFEGGQDATDGQGQD